eukprot:s1426_g28.t1
MKQVGLLGLALLGLCAQAAKLHLEAGWGHGSMEISWLRINNLSKEIECDSFQCDLEKGWSPKPDHFKLQGSTNAQCCRPTCRRWKCGHGYKVRCCRVDEAMAKVMFPQHVPVLVTVQLEGTGSECSKKLLLPKTLKAGELLAVLPKHVKFEDKDIPWAHMQVQVGGNLPAAEQQMGEIWSSQAADVLPITLQQPREAPRQGAASVAKRPKTQETTEQPRKRRKGASGFGGIVVDVARMGLWSLAGYILVGSEAAAAAGFTAACAKALM